MGGIRMGPAAVVALAGFGLGAAAALAAIGAGLGHRFGFWGYREGFAALGWIVYAGAAGAALSLIGIVLTWKSRRGFLVLALIGLVLGAAVAWIPYQSRMMLRASPSLPDVTTDTARPPVFVAAVALRAADQARNPLTYGPAKARLQAQHYPDIQPVQLDLPMELAFQKALAAVRAEGLELTAIAPSEGRIEALATTFWFGFKDDVVVRIEAASGGSRVDIRSVSRVGGRDGGANAARVRKLAARIAK